METIIDIPADQHPTLRQVIITRTFAIPAKLDRYSGTSYEGWPRPSSPN